MYVTIIGNIYIYINLIYRDTSKINNSYTTIVLLHALLLPSSNEQLL